MSIEHDFGKWIAEYCPYQKEIFDDNVEEIIIHKTAAIGPTTNIDAWVDAVWDKLPDIATLRHLVERTGNGKIVFYGNPESMNNIKEFLEHYEHNVIDEAFVIKATDRRYMLIEPDIKPIKKDPFWTQQGKRTKGKRGRYQ